MLMTAAAPSLPSAWRTALLTTAIATMMFAFGYAMIPLYYRFCAFIGIDTATSSTLATIRTPPPVRELRVEFDANSHNNLVAMQPAQRLAQMNTGTAYSITYEIRNLTNEPLRGTAVPSYAPARAAAWFNKLQCFCFDELELAPGEILRAPVVFVLERELPPDIVAVALSYTFHLDPASHAHSR